MDEIVGPLWTDASTAAASELCSIRLPQTRSWPLKPSPLQHGPFPLGPAPSPTWIVTPTRQTPPLAASHSRFISKSGSTFPEALLHQTHPFREPGVPPPFSGQTPPALTVSSGAAPAAACP